MLLDLLYGNAARRPDGEAVVHGNTRMTHAELADRVERLAAGLADGVGIGPGDGVALLLPSDPTFVVTWYAVSALGGVIVPLNPAFKPDEIEGALTRCGVRAVICGEPNAGVCERIVAGWRQPAEVIPTRDGHGHALTLDLLMGGEPVRFSQEFRDEPLVNMFSSGSMGRPKLVARTHRQCRAEADLYPSLGIGPEDRILCTVPLFHTYGMGCCMLAAARAGATLVMLEDPRPLLLRRRRALELLEAERITVYPGVPFAFRLLADAPASADLSRLRLCFSAGTALARPVFDAFLEKFGVSVRQLYGCTEAGTLTANVDDDPVASFASVGQPVSPVDVRIEDENGETLGTGVVGEVAVKSPALTSGYADMADLNRTLFRDGYFRPGDLGRLDRHGRLTLTGRTKLLIETGGQKVDPIEVEDVVAAHPQVQQAVVVGVDTGVAGEEVIKAVVVPVSEIDERELIRFCQRRLANFKVPQVVEVREDLPTSPLGKVLRKYLV